jgi:glucokinase
MLVAFLASEAGNLFLKVFATGGIYLRDEEQIAERPDVTRVIASARDRTRAM